MRRRPERPSRMPHDHRAGPAPEARRDHACRRRSAGGLDEPSAKSGLTFLHVEMVVIGIVTIAGLVMSLQSFWRWIMAMLPK